MYTILYERKNTVHFVRWSTHFLQQAPYILYGGRKKKGVIKMMKNVLSAEKREELAREIFNWLNKHKIWVDVTIYFNGKCWSTSNEDNTEFCYNENRYFEYEADPRNYFEYVREPNILSMAFEGDLYEILNGYSYGWVKREEELKKIFEKYGLYFELGNAWNLSCFEI